MGRRAKPRTWQRARRLAWLRFRAQCKFKGEASPDWELWQELWNTEDLFLSKGRTNQSLFVSKIDFEKPYSRNNICLTTGHASRRYNQHYQHGMASGIPEQDIIRRLD